MRSIITEVDVWRNDEGKDMIKFRLRHESVKEGSFMILDFSDNYS